MTKEKHGPGLEEYTRAEEMMSEKQKTMSYLLRKKLEDLNVDPSVINDCKLTLSIPDDDSFSHNCQTISGTVKNHTINGLEHYDDDYSGEIDGITLKKDEARLLWDRLYKIIELQTLDFGKEAEELIGQKRREKKEKKIESERNKKLQNIFNDIFSE